MSNAKGNSGFRGSGLMDLGGRCAPCLSTFKYHLDHHVRDGLFSVHTCIPQLSNMWQGVKRKSHANLGQTHYSENCWFYKDLYLWFVYLLKWNSVRHEINVKGFKRNLTPKHYSIYAK